ncbi:tigger transposable element-derived protein 6-like [Zootermopsis nevadensis]|uniref:tigger transposable element-derived protein 6-like n=1 Tax=Zootermopsis nevadensis TaxID=136037 RepID=UPI000B8EADC4|nr:tigger transposable element-derived protein 6-like [Zootermopsis nevadensis]
MEEKAREIATRLHTEDFSASNGWLDRFRKRNNISLHVLSGESASADLQAAEDWKRKLPSLLLGYAEEDIFNADESGLFYRQHPTRSLIERRETCKGGKKSKERITVLLCCNSRGEKLKPVVIVNAARPRAFKTNNVKLDDLPVIWCHNKKAWMTSKIYPEWLNEVNLKMKRANRKILLLVDNATSHVSSNLSNVSIQFLPPNLTSEVQPLDKGIIQSVKLLYRKQLMHSLINAADKCKDVTEFSRSVTVLDAIRWILGAWAEVSHQTIAKCFRHAGFMADSIEDEEEGMEEDSFHEEINCLPEEIATKFLMSKLFQRSTTF